MVCGDFESHATPNETRTMPLDLFCSHHALILFISSCHSNSTSSFTSLLSYTMALQLQAPTTRSHLAPPSPLAAPKGNAGLRLPPDRFALKSSFFSSSHHLLLLSPKQRPLASSAAPKFSMRVASKGAYICRDCGYHILHLLFLTRRYSKLF